MQSIGCDCNQCGRCRSLCIQLRNGYVLLCGTMMTYLANISKQQLYLKTNQTDPSIEARVADTLVNVFLTVWPAEGCWAGTNMAVWPSVIAGAPIYTGALMPTNIFINLAESARVARVTQTFSRALAAAMSCSIWTSKNGTKNIENKIWRSFFNVIPCTRISRQATSHVISSPWSAHLSTIVTYHTRWQVYTEYSSVRSSLRHNCGPGI